MDWEIYEMNVNIVFFNRTLEVEIYVHQPEDFV